MENDSGLFNQTAATSLRQCMGQCVAADTRGKTCNSIVLYRESQISNRCQLHDVAVGENNIASESSDRLLQQTTLVQRQVKQSHSMFSYPNARSQQ